MYEPKKSRKLRPLTPTIASAVNMPMPRKQANVTFAPPILSDRKPPTGRESDPISALWVFLGAYAVFAGMTWFFYLRRSFLTNKVPSLASASV